MKTVAAIVATASFLGSVGAFADGNALAGFWAALMCLSGVADWLREHVQARKT
jgi:hypothetical protein